MYVLCLALLFNLNLSDEYNTNPEQPMFVFLGPATMTAAGAVVKPGSNIKTQELWLGVPARYLRQRELPAAASSTGELKA